jgi:predicted negative regulator of RcsB-dependent stress response
VSDQDQVKRSRRAKRRAEQGDDAVAPPASEPAAEPSEGEAASAGTTEGKKRKAKPAKPEEIRDRNRRLREEGAESRRERRARDRAAPARGLDAGEMVDDALARSTQATVGFLKRYFGVIQWVVVLGIAGGVAWQIYTYRHDRQTAQASDGLMKGVRASLGLVGVDRSSEPKELKELVNPLPEYASEAERAKAATTAYKEFLEKAEATSNRALLAKLGLAGIAYDTGKYDDAKKLYEEVKGSKLASEDSDVKARATEGVGLALEAKGERDAALKVFRALENSDVPGFGMLGLYHQARIWFAQGERDKAKDAIVRVRAKLAKVPEEEKEQYLDYATGQLLRVLDPAEYAKTAQPASQYTPEQLAALQKQIMEDPAKLKDMLKNLGQSGGNPVPVPVPAAPTSDTPSAPPAGSGNAP